MAYNEIPFVDCKWK